MRPARPPDALQYVGLFFLFVSGGLAFESHPIPTEYVRMAEGVGFEPTWRLAPPSRFRVDPVTATSVPLRAGKAVL